MFQKLKSVKLQKSKYCWAYPKFLLDRNAAFLALSVKKKKSIVNNMRAIL